MSSILRRIVTRLRVSLFPSKHDKEVKRWFADDGDGKLRYEYDLDSDSLVIDLGGYAGQWASDIYARYNCRVLVFEPVKSFAEKIDERFRKNPKVEVFCQALGSNRRQELIALSADGSSVYRNSCKNESIQFEDVVTFFTDHNIEEVDLMKINVEGGEYELLPRLFEVGLIHKIKRIQVQFHDFVPDALTEMNSIREKLSLTHYPTYKFDFVWDNWKLKE